MSNWVIDMFEKTRGLKSTPEQNKCLISRLLQYFPTVHSVSFFLSLSFPPSLSDSAETNMEASKESANKQTKLNKTDKHVGVCLFFPACLGQTNIWRSEKIV